MNLIDLINQFLEQQNQYLSYNYILQIIKDDKKDPALINHYQQANIQQLKNLVGEFDIVIDEEQDPDNPESYYTIVFFKQFNQYLKFNGYLTYLQYHQINNLELVTPIQITITKWKTI